ncbi:MAG: hypothetical protein LH609_14585, partial [Rudanella sp.]|nr:hypothetical protein [Rudanella sp.]
MSLQAMMVLSLQAGADLCRILDNPSTASQYAAAVAWLKTNIPAPNDSKQGAALSGLMPPQQANREVLAVGGAKNFPRSTATNHDFSAYATAGET